MDKHNALADKIENAVKELFSHSEMQHSGVYNYALMYSDEISNKWVLVLFVNNKENLNSLLESGFCYDIYVYLMNKFASIETVWIHFDTGQYPSNTDEYKQLLKKHATEYGAMKNEEGKDTICRICGHNFKKHRLMGRKDKKTYPEEGWMICPEDDCFCFSTWSILRPDEYKLQYDEMQEQIEQVEPSL